MRDYYVYILASKSRELYIGVTNNLTRRLAEHRAGIDPDDHCYRHEIIRLVHVERTTVYVTRSAGRSNSRAGDECGKSN
jgi:putative endonuclease